MPRPLLLLAALGIVSALAQDDTAPRALPVVPETDTPAPKAVPVAPVPVELAPAAPEGKAPRAELVLPGDPETLLPDQQPRKALPVLPEVPRATAVVPKATPVVPTEESAKPNEIPKAQPVLKQPKGEFKPPPLLIPEKGMEEGEETEEAPIGAAWETRTEARTLTLKIPAPRGQITDRYGYSLAQNKVGFFLALKLPFLGGASDAEVINYATSRMRSASSKLGVAWTLDDAVILKHYKNRRWLPLPFSPLLTDAQTAIFEKDIEPGLELFPTYQRHYPEGATACHIVGYVGTKARAPTGPVASGDPLWATTEGREGLEVTCDQFLQGKQGSINFLFDTDGAKLAEETVKRPAPGRNVVTSIDLEMQKLAEESLAKYTDRGAFIIMDVQTGDIYAMASRPTYDINVWVPSISTEEFKALQEDPDLPLFPRAFRGQYPPASTFKVSVALAALEAGVVDGETLIGCPPSISIGKEIFRNWRKTGEGDMNVVGAIRRSCNTWFYTVGRMAGGDAVSSMAHRFGYGSKTGLPLNAEASGFMPTDALSRERFGVPFSHGYLAHASIGQGSVLSTPLQVAQMMAGIGNGYSVPKPRLLLQVQEINGSVVESFPPVGRNALNVQPHNLGYVRQGMIDVVNSSAGTAKSARNDYVTLAGKTGTGQWVQKGEKLYLSWFAGFVPAENPKYAFAAVCEGSPGEYITGGKKSAPMVGQYFNTLYSRKKERGELEGYAKTAAATQGVSVVSTTEPTNAPEATRVEEGRPITEAPPRRRGLFNFRRNRR